MLYTRGIKFILDKILALLLLIIFAPLLGIVAIFIYFKMGAPIFFRQTRPGKDEVLFEIIKFRTMQNVHDENGELLSDEQRLHGLGKMIRKLSLDELPQLINVLRGEMSFVGPRPLLVEYLPLYTQEQKKRHLVLPGITGWAQVNGRNAISWEQKFEYDIWYVENQSFLLDMKIIWMTFLKILQQSDVSSNTSVTMEKFRGYNNERG